MLEIRVNGQLLDIVGQDVTMTWQSFVFAGAIPDQFSTDIELPRTDVNSQILKPFGILDGINNFRNRIPCAVSIDIVGCDGYMQVSALKRNSITATLFLNSFPYNLLDRKIRDIMRGQVGIMPWDVDAPSSYISGHGSGLQRSLFVNAGGIFALPWSLRLSEFLVNLGNVAGCNFNLPFSDIYRIVAATPKVSPYNTLQLVQANIKGNVTAPLDDRINMIAGQHVCTDVNSPRELRQNINITRKCKAKFTGLAGRGSLYITIGGVQHIYYMPYYQSFALSPGDSFFYACPYNDNWMASVLKVEYSDYLTNDEDTDTLIFPGRINDPDGAPIAFYTLPEGVDAGGVEYRYDGTGGNPRYSFAYMDYWWCIGNMTVRELLNSLSRLKGLPIISQGNNILFDTDTEIQTDGDIVSILPQTETLGKTTLLKFNSKSERTPQEMQFAGQFLAESVTIFESIFYGAIESPTGNAQVTLFKMDDSVTLGLTWQDCGAVMLKEISYMQGGGTYYGLAPLPDLQWMEINKLTDTVEVEIETMTDLRGYTYCYYEGRKYMLIEANLDANSGFCTARMLLVI